MITVRRYLLAFAWITSLLSKASALVACGILVEMIAHTLIEIVMRSFLNTSTFALDEYVGYGVAAATALGAAHALETGSLIRVTLLLKLIKGQPGLCRVIEVVSSLVACSLIVFLSQYLWKSVARNFVRGTTSETVMATPLWVPEALVLVGLLVLALRFLGIGIEAALSNEPDRETVVNDSINMQGL